MAEVDTRILLNSLKAYRKSLERHLNNVQAEFDALQARWYAFDAVYAGDAAEEFKKGWALTTANFQEYLSRVQAISKMLDGRIEHLEDANRPTGLN